ncbi:hypothetical protein ACH5RR_035875 [Cinchona calisaya]|uniref:HTH myb-type domain-containing protein n=1 Tax=Cinchona calisaya TaxID=153742 RepID=A0ABD2Y1I9_9GENT
MALQNVQNKEMGLVLSSDAKPRLKWTPELHQRFIDAVNQLGGADKATPKSLMRVMGIHGLTLYHLKSHLQKYRLGKSQQSQNYNENYKPEEGRENQRSHLTAEICEGTQNQINESLQIAQALQMQMEVQRKLYEQIEVQRHLQLRIEAQGKYLQSVLKKAQETLAEYDASAVGLELAKAELSQLVSMVDIGCPGSSVSVLTDVEGSILKDTENKQLTGNGCSLESSLTSSESSDGRKEQTKPVHEIEETDNWKRNSALLSLMEMQTGQSSGLNNQASERKRTGSNISVEKPLAKRFQSQRSDEQPRKLEFLGTIDLNRKYLNDFDSGQKTLELNFQ